MLRHPALIPLSHEHQHGLALCLLTERALNADSSPENVSAQARAIIEQFDQELQGHFDTEEQILFPVLALLPEVQELVAELIEEHQRMLGIVERLRKESPPELVRNFVSILREHIRKEESRLFESAQRLLTQEDLENLARAIERRSAS
jgi:hemerythrin-like domain-containing protein